MSEVEVFWSPAHSVGVQYNFSHLYPAPKSLYEESFEQKADLKENKDDFFRCPAVSNKMKRTFVFRSVTDTHVKVFGKEHIEYWVANEDDQRRHQTVTEILHEPTMRNRWLVNYLHPIVFFTPEDSLIASMTPPYFEQTESQKYGAIVPGEFDIGKWFRPMNFEFQLWEGVDELRVASGDALGYVQFNTDKKVVLKKFNLNNQLNKITGSLIHVSPFRRFMRLSERYKMFEQSKLKHQILREIRQELME